MSDDPAREPELLTITEAAELLRAPVATLRYWRHRGTGPRSFRLGRRVLYPRDHLQAWVEGRGGRRKCRRIANRRRAAVPWVAALASSDLFGMLRADPFRPPKAKISYAVS